MNLLVLRLATINAEEKVAERLEAAEAAKQAVHLEGDVINPNIRKNYSYNEKPEHLDNISVCSCACMDSGLWRKKRDGVNKRSKNKLFSFFQKSAIVKRLFMKKRLKKGVPCSPSLAQDEINNIEMNNIDAKNNIEQSKRSLIEQLNQINFISDTKKT